MIGIKLADGTLFPVIEENEHVTKRLVLTTVRDGQNNVKIDLYRASRPGSGVQEAVFVAALVLENVPARPAGGLDVVLNLGIDAGCNLNVEAQEPQSGERQRLSISLEYLSEGCPDPGTLDLELNEDRTNDLVAANKVQRSDSADPAESADRSGLPRRAGHQYLLYATFALLVLALIGLAICVVSTLLSHPAAPRL